MMFFLIWPSQEPPQVIRTTVSSARATLLPASSTTKPANANTRIKNRLRNSPVIWLSPRFAFFLSPTHSGRARHLDSDDGECHAEYYSIRQTMQSYVRSGSHRRVGSREA